ncbi:hypothetical protein AX14_009753 [Amanita brunnescens Koide BX004]|nr:hypothetical protein AX14_009753 [Amanita brunnescens Koide BX004]
MPSAPKKSRSARSITNLGNNKKNAGKAIVDSQKQLDVERRKVVEDEEDEDDGDEEGDDGDAIDKSESEDEEDGEDEDDGVYDDGGIDREGMERLMNALGEDGLDDYDRAHLIALRASDGEEGDEEGDEVESHGEEEASVEDEAEAKSGSESEEEDVEETEKLQAEKNGEDEDEDVDEGVALDEVESVDEDAVPRHKVQINNTAALERIRETIKLDPALPWTETLAVTYPENIEVDVDDDLQRELAFYKQALHSANVARALAAKHSFPFTRPADYFAEMVKSDAHMERIRQRLLDESAGIKRGEEKRREREGKKFGKQVQLEKLKEREKSKKDMDERLKVLKRKRKDMLNKPEGGEDFDVAVEDAIADRPAKRAKGQGGPKLGRTARDKKYGFGGSKKHAKQNTRASTDNFSPGAGKGKGGRKPGMGKRPGKSKRMAARSKR